MRSHCRYSPIVGLLLGLALPAVTEGLLARQATGDVALVHRLFLDQEMVVVPAQAPERQAALGERLRHMDEVWTSSNTRAAIRFIDDGTLVRLNPDSRLRVHVEGEDRSALTRTLEVEFGELWARVTRREEAEFRIRTPTGVAAVKGTTFLVRVEEDGTTTVITLEGLLEFFNDAGTIDIAEGQRTRVTSQDQNPEVEDADPTELAGFSGLTEEDQPPSEEEEALIDVPIRLRDAQGQIRTLMIQLRRGELDRFLDRSDVR